MLRIFVAIQFSEEVKSALVGAQEAMKDRGVKGNWCSESNLHLTMAFIGETDQVELIKKAVEEVRFEPFEIWLSKLDYFKTKHGTVVWCGIDNEEALNPIADNLRERLRHYGIRYASTLFKPHVSLVKGPSRLITDIDLENVGMRVTEMSVMKSERVNGVMVYERI